MLFVLNIALNNSIKPQIHSYKPLQALSESNLQV